MKMTTIQPARRLKYYRLVNDSGEDLGQIQEFMLDIVQGRVAFVVVAFSGILGLTDKWFALPWELLEWSAERGEFICHMAREVLESAPGLNKKAWPDEIDLSWLRDCYAHFGCTPHWDKPAVTEGQIQRLAYSIWEQAGRPEGKAAEHYYQAENMLREEQERSRELQTADIA